jgi:uncharacterized membrane protein
VTANDQKPRLATWHEKHQASLGFGARVADMVASFVGSWTFLIIHAFWFAAWIGFRMEPFPYGLLTMIVSLEAIFLSTFIMISQNRQGDRDRHQAEDDYETNKVAKEEIERLQKDLARIELEKLDKLITLLEKKR